MKRLFCILLCLASVSCGGRENSDLSLRLPDIKLPTLPDDPEFTPSTTGIAGTPNLFNDITDRFLGRRTDPVSVKDSATGFQSELEPNNSPETAQKVSLTGSFWGWVHPPVEEEADVDWYLLEVELDESAVLTVELAGVKGIDLWLELWKKTVDGKNRKLTHVDAWGAGENEKLDNWLLNNGQFYLVVGSRKSGRGQVWNIVDPYKLTFSLRPTSDSIELEPNNDYRKATRPVPGKTIQASLDFGDEDWYQIETTALPVDGAIALQIEPAKDLELYWTLVTPDRQELGKGVLSKGQKLCLHSLAVPQQFDSYFVQIRAIENLDHSASYTLLWDRATVEDATERELNDSLETASGPFAEPATIHGWFNDAEDSDYIRVKTRPGFPVQISLDGAEGRRHKLDVLGPKGLVLLAMRSEKPGDPIEISNFFPEADELVLRLRTREGAGCDSKWSLVVQSREGEGEEKENNDTLADAQLVSELPAKIRGFMAWPGDRDCFVIPSSLRLQNAQGRFSSSLVNESSLPLRLTSYLAGSAEPVEQQTVKPGTSNSIQMKGGEGPAILLCVEVARDSGSRARAEPYTFSVDVLGNEPLDDGR